MNRSSAPAISGVYSSLGILPHLVFLLILFLLNLPCSLGYLVMSHIVAIFCGEYLFFKRLSINIPFLSWLNEALHPRTPGYFLWAYISEILFDVIFLVLAIKYGWHPVTFFLVLIGCKFLAAPLQVYLSRHYLSNNASYALAVPTQVLCLITAHNFPELFIYVVIFKGLVCNSIAVARSQYVSEVEAS